MDGALIADIFVVLICGFLLYKYGKLSIYHPGTIYLAFHLFAFTSKFFMIWTGVAAFFTDYSDFIPPTSEELVRAIFWADVALFLMTMAWIWEARRKPKQVNNYKIVNDKVILGVMTFTIPFGIIGMLLNLYIPGIGRIVESDGKTVIDYLSETLLSHSLMILIYRYGFKYKYVVIISLILIILGVQGYHRFRIVTPILFFLAYYFYLEKKKWPNFKIILLGVVFIAIFFPLKFIGRGLQEEGALEAGLEMYAEQKENGDADNSFLEQYAMTLSLVDKKEKYFYLSVFYPLIVSPIPRAIWPDKPAQNEYLIEISTPDRPLDKIGGISTILGEAYVITGIFGILLIPFLFAKYSGRWYFYIQQSNFMDVNVFLYMIFFSILIQVYRDGLVFGIVFIAIYSMPLFLVYLLSRIFGKRIYL